MVGDIACHLSPRASVSRKPSRSTAVYAPTWPCHRRHFEQWQYVTPVRGLLTSYRIAPQKQPPLFMGGIYHDRRRRTAIALARRPRSRDVEPPVANGPAEP